MTKQEFLTRLREGLSDLPQGEAVESVTFYSEMIDDRMEEGLSEEEAVAHVGTLPEILAQILGNADANRYAQESKPTKRKMKGWELALLVLGSPLWLALGIAAVAVAFSLVVALFVTLWAVAVSLGVALWAVVVSLWAASFSLAACGVAGGLLFFLFIFVSEPIKAFMLLGMGLICAGLAIFGFFGGKAATKGACRLTKIGTQGVCRLTKNACLAIKKVCKRR